MAAFIGKVTLTPRSFDDDPFMGFNRRKMEDRRHKAAEQEAATRRAVFYAKYSGNGWVSK
jgi:hypothetical protein